MKNPFRNRKKEAVVSHTTVPKDWFSMTMAEKMDWAGQLLEGLAPDVEKASPDLVEDPDGSVTDCAGYTSSPTGRQRRGMFGRKEEQAEATQDFGDDTEVTTCRGYGPNPPSQDDTNKS